MSLQAMTMREYFRGVPDGACEYCFTPSIDHTAKPEINPDGSTVCRIAGGVTLPTPKGGPTVYVGDLQPAEAP